MLRRSQSRSRSLLAPPSGSRVCQHSPRWLHRDREGLPSPLRAHVTLATRGKPFPRSPARISTAVSLIRFLSIFDRQASPSLENLSRSGPVSLPSGQLLLVPTNAGAVYGLEPRLQSPQLLRAKRLGKEHADDTQHQRLHVGVYTKIYTDSKNSGHLGPRASEWRRHENNQLQGSVSLCPLKTSRVHNLPNFLRTRRSTN